VRRGLALIWLGATAVVSAVVGFISYGAGWAAGAAAHVPAAAGPYYYGGPHFGFFGFLPFLFVLFVLFLVFRAGRRRGPWGWGGGWGYRGYGVPPQPGAQVPPSGDPWAGWPQRPQPQPQQPQAAPPEQDRPAQ
jgi:hypothetical protein